MKAAGTKSTSAVRVNDGKPSNGLPSLTTEIANLAHSYWEAEGRPEGKDLEHWFRAEAEVTTGKTRRVRDA